MTDRTATRYELAPNAGAKQIILKSGTTFCAVTDTLTLTLADYGVTNVLAVRGFVHTTDLSVIVAESGTTAVTTGVLTYTPASGNADKRRVVIIEAE